MSRRFIFTQTHYHVPNVYEPRYSMIQSIKLYHQKFHYLSLLLHLICMRCLRRLDKAFVFLFFPRVTFKRYDCLSIFKQIHGLVFARFSVKDLAIDTCASYRCKILHFARQLFCRSDDGHDTTRRIFIVQFRRYCDGK